MTDPVGKINNLREKSNELARKMDEEDGKKDGLINYSVWNNFVQGKGGRTIVESINLYDAARSIRTYAQRQTASAAADKVEEWLNPSEEKGVKPAPEEKAKEPSQKVAVKVKSPKADATSYEMEAHDAKIAKLEKESDEIISKFNSATNAKDFQKLNITKENIAYILQKEPEFLDKVKDRYGTFGLKTVLKAISDSKNEKNIDAMSDEKLTKALADAVKDLSVENKYGKQTIQAKRNAESAQRYIDNNKVHVGESEVTEKIKTAKNNAKELEADFNKGKKDAGQAIADSDKNTLAYLFKDAATVTKIVDKLKREQANKVKATLGLKTDATDAEVAKKAAEIRKELESSETKDKQELGNAQALFDKAAEIFSKFESDVANRTVKKVKDNIYRIKNSDGTFADVHLDKNGKVSQIVFFDPAQSTKKAIVSMKKDKLFYNTDLTNDGYEGSIKTEVWGKYSLKLQTYINAEKNKELSHKVAVDSAKNRMKIKLPPAPTHGKSYSDKAEKLGADFNKGKKDAGRAIADASKNTLAYLFKDAATVTKIVDKLKREQANKVKATLGLRPDATDAEVAKKAANIRAEFKAWTEKDQKNYKDAQPLFDKYSDVMAELANTPKKIGKITKLNKNQYEVTVKGSDVVILIEKNNSGEIVKLAFKSGVKQDITLEEKEFCANPDKTGNEPDVKISNADQKSKFAIYKEAAKKILESQ